jgi:hypothetical protein
LALIDLQAVWPRINKPKQSTIQHDIRIHRARRREIAAIETLIIAGHPDLQGLCLAVRGVADD